METTIVKCCECDETGTKNDLTPCHQCGRYMCIRHCCKCDVTISSAEEWKESFVNPVPTDATFPMVLSFDALGELLG